MEKKPNGCMINQKIKTYLTRQPKMQACIKIVTNYSKKITIFFCKHMQIVSLCFQSWRSSTAYTRQWEHDKNNTTNQHQHHQHNEVTTTPKEQAGGKW
jgi:hypothetical protein